MRLVEFSTVLVTIILIGSLLILTVSAISPPNPPPNYMMFTEDTAGSPSTVDPAIAYDTASCGMIFNVYDTLITFNTQNLDQYLSSVADQWWSQNITGTTSPAGIPWYWRYTFHIRHALTFAAPNNYALTTEDVQYSFWRTMILDASGGPEWMLDEPLLNNAGGPNLLGNMANEADVSRVGRIIEESVGCNDSYVWFNIAYPAPYGPFLQIVCQTWSSILSKQYINNQIIGAEGISDWNGNWATRSTKYPSWNMTNIGWIDQFDVYTGGTGPLDVNSEHMYGSGPFMLTNIDFVNNFWSMTRNTAYFRGWPADFPVMAAAGPAGYCNDIRQNFGLGWAARKAHLLAGTCDFAAVPRNRIGEVYQNANPPFSPPNYPEDGIRCYSRLLGLEADAMFFTFSIDTATPYGTIFAPGVYGPNGIPSDFFSNAVTGVHVRKAFAYAMNYSAYLQQALYGEAQHVYTALIPGLQYYDPSVKGYDFNLAAAAAELAQVPGIMANGFNVTFLYNPGNLARQTAATILQTDMALINSTFVVTPLQVDFSAMLTAMMSRQAPIFQVGWLADFPDMHDFASGFYSGSGADAFFAVWQGYNNATINADIDAGIAAQDGQARQVAYTKLARDVIADCPNVVLDQPFGRHFERDWVEGWYYSSMYPDIYYYNLWKWYYLPHALYNPPTQPTSYRLPADVNLDRVVNIKDVSTIAHLFLARAGPPIDPRWIFRCDINNDGIIDARDLAYVARNFNPTRTSDPWVPGP